MDTNDIKPYVQKTTDAIEKSLGLQCSLSFYPEHKLPEEIAGHIRSQALSVSNDGIKQIAVDVFKEVHKYGATFDSYDSVWKEADKFAGCMYSGTVRDAKTLAGDVLRLGGGNIQDGMYKYDEAKRLFAEANSQDDSEAGAAKSIEKLAKLYAIDGSPNGLGERMLNSFVKDPWSSKLPDYRHKRERIADDAVSVSVQMTKEGSNFKTAMEKNNKVVDLVQDAAAMLRSKRNDEPTKIERAAVEIAKALKESPAATEAQVRLMHKRILEAKVDPPLLVKAYERALQQKSGG